MAFGNFGEMQVIFRMVDHRARYDQKCPHLLKAISMDIYLGDGVGPECY